MKKPKLTKEERRARKKAKREAARLRRIQKEIQAKKDWLDRETKATDMNSVVIKTKWRDIMRRLRGPQLYDDFLALRLRSERLMDMKSAMIDEMREALDEANDQYETNLQHHVEVVDTMLDFFHGQMEAAAAWYRRTLNKLVDGLDEYKADAQARQQRDVQHLDVILFAMQEARTGEAVQRRADTTARLDEENVKHAERFQVMQTRLEGALERQWDALTLALRQHHAQHGERRAAVARLRAKEQAEQRVIAEQKRRTRLLYRQIEEGVELVRAWDTSEPAGGGASSDDWAELLALRHERGEFRAAYAALRHAMDSQRQHDRRQMEHMVVRAEAAVQRLREIATRGEKVLSLACLCLALETDDDRRAFPEDDGLDDWQAEFWVRGRVARWGDIAEVPGAEDAVDRPAEGSHTCFTNLDADLSAEVASDGGDEAAQTSGRAAAAAQLEEEQDFMAEAVQSLEGLSAFWGRAGEAEVGRQQLRETVAQLRAEQAQLHAELRVYLRAAAPTWSGPDPVPRGPADLRVYEPPHRPRGTTPWRGIRAVGM